MANILREQAQFAKGKTPIIAKYGSDHHRLFSEIAGRGFLNLPGYAYTEEGMLELTAKLQLSELNYKILAETIDREMKQAGVDYDIAYKNAMMEWELEKQALLNAWEAELAQMKLGMAEEEELLNRMAIEIAMRAILLMEAKTAIELEAEGYRKQLVDLEATATPYEFQLANAKLLTAQKKLELLPIVQAMIAVEYELLEIERGKAVIFEEYIAAENELMEKKKTLLPHINTLAALSEQYAQDITNIQVPAETQIINEKAVQAQVEVQVTGNKVLEIQQATVNERKKILLLAGERILKTLQFTDEQRLLVDEISLLTAWHEAKVRYEDAILELKKSLLNDETAIKKEAYLLNIETKKESTKTLEWAEWDADDLRANASIDEIEQKATIQAAQDITASLRHVIG